MAAKTTQANPVSGTAREKMFECQECGARYANQRNSCAKCGGSDLDLIAPPTAQARSVISRKAQRLVAPVANAETQAIADEADATVEDPMFHVETVVYNADAVQTPSEVAAEDAVHAERNAEIAAAVNAKLDATAAAMDEVLAGDAASRCPKCEELLGYNAETGECYNCGLNTPDGTILWAPKEGATMTTATKTKRAATPKAAKTPKEKPAHDGEMFSAAGTPIKLCPTCGKHRIPVTKKDCKPCRKARLVASA